MNEQTIWQGIDRLHDEGYTELIFIIGCMEHFFQVCFGVKMAIEFVGGGVGRNFDLVILQCSPLVFALFEDQICPFDARIFQGNAEHVQHLLGTTGSAFAGGQPHEDGRVPLSLQGSPPVRAASPPGRDGLWG